MSERINDRRTDEDRANTAGFVVATDSFMSGWGKADGGRSLFAVPFSAAQYNEGIERVILGNMEDRSEMKRPRIVGPDYKPRMGPGDHLSIRAMADGPWVERGGFRR